MKRSRVSDPASRFERLTIKSPRLCRGMSYFWMPILVKSMPGKPGMAHMGLSLRRL